MSRYYTESFRLITLLDSSMATMKDYYKDRPELPVEQITARIDGAFHRFFAGFHESAGITHSLSKGEVRENPVRDFFESLLPKRFSVASGEIIDSRGGVSPQSDLIVYRASDGIPILNAQPTILQIESVMCVTEVKSVINTEEYEDCLKKAKKLFELRPFDKQLQGYERGRDLALKIVEFLFRYLPIAQIPREGLMKRRSAILNAQES